MTAATLAPGPCSRDTLDHCTVCGHAMHRRGGRTCRNGHRMHEGRGLCSRCYDVLAGRGLLDGHPRSRRDRDELLRAWADLTEIGAATYTTFADTVGMTRGAWERAFQRARAAGHPLACRYDRGA